MFFTDYKLPYTLFFLSFVFKSEIEFGDCIT